MAKTASDNNDIKPQLYRIIFGHETPAGKLFDLLLIYLIITSVFIVILDSLSIVPSDWKFSLKFLEWAFTILFTFEYVLRVYCSPNRWRYVFSFYGLVDLLSIFPTYLSLFMTDISYLLIVRLLRVLRVFRILKLARYLSEANILSRSLLMSRRKILVFFSAVMVLATIFGSLMFIVEGPENGFTSIPRSIYWTIVTITTVGYGDITPHTMLGQIIATMVMLTGYSIIAVPTGVFTAEIAQEMQRQRQSKHCQNCERSGHENDANYCRFCGAELPI
ncbi:MAG: voltage-gated potassium channel [Cellvibrionaceae bacterium]|jgi:voltage-gated potassium channel